MAYQDQYAAKQKTASPDPEKSYRSNSGAVQRRRETGYIPYQDSPYYNDHSSSSDYPDYDARDRRRDDSNYREVYEQVRRRRYNSDARTSRSRNNERSNDEDYEEKGMYPARSPYYPDLAYQDDRRRNRRDPSSSNSDSRYRSRSRSRNRNRSRSRSSSRNRSSRSRRSRQDHYTRYEPHQDPDKPKESYTVLKAVKSALMAGGVEAVRCRSEPGTWTGQKGRRIAVAAVTGTAIGALRNGRLMAAGKMPYADAAMTGFYAIDFLKRVARHTEHGQNALKEQRDWHDDRDFKQEAEDRWGGNDMEKLKSIGRRGDSRQRSKSVGR